MMPVAGGSQAVPGTGDYCSLPIKGQADAQPWA